MLCNTKDTSGNVVTVSTTLCLMLGINMNPSLAHRSYCVCIPSQHDKLTERWAIVCDAGPTIGRRIVSTMMTQHKINIGLKSCVFYI